MLVALSNDHLISCTPAPDRDALRMAFVVLFVPMPFRTSLDASLQISWVAALAMFFSSPLCKFTKHPYVSHSAISSETIGSIWAMLVNISMEYFVKEFDDLK